MLILLPPATSSVTESRISKLPKELFVDVLLHLNFSVQLRCIHVSKYWHQILTQEILYSSLDLTELDAFDKAMRYISNHTIVGNNVRHLKVKDFFTYGRDINQCLTAMPNVKLLVWQCLLNYGLPNDNYQRDINQEALKHWSQSLEYIIEMPSSSPLCFAVSMLKNHTCRKLRQLEISCNQQPFPVVAQSKIMHSLTNVIHNAPNLTNLKFHNIFIKFEDLDIIHAALPHLTHLSLSEVSGEQKVLRQTVPKVNQHKLTTFKMDECFALIHERNRTELETMVKNWMYYIKVNYQDLQELWFDYGGYYSRFNPTPDSLYLDENILINTIQNMKKLTKYNVNVFPITRRVFETFKSNGNELESIAVRVDRTELIDSVFNRLATYQPTATTIKLLYKNDMDQELRNCMRDSIMFKYLGNNVTHLNIQLFKGNAPLFLDVLKLLPNLEALVFDHVEISAEDYIDPSWINRDRFFHSPPPSRRLKKLQFKIETKCGINILGQPRILQAFFELMANSCTENLQEIKIVGTLDRSFSHGVYFPHLNLDFSQHKKLKAIEIDMDKFKSYTFNGDTDKYWYNCKKVIPRHKIEECTEYGANLNIAFDKKIVEKIDLQDLS